MKLSGLLAGAAAIVLVAAFALSRQPRAATNFCRFTNRYTSADLVNRSFDRDGPYQVWMTDITERPTAEGRVFCCAVLDAWSRRIVGWSVDRRARSAMVNAALGMAVEQRGQGALIHTDHGPQFTSWTFSRAVGDSTRLLCYAAAVRVIWS